jgi:hypothetical protein
MVPVKVTVAVGRKTVALENVQDARIRRGLEDAAKSVGTALDGIVCPMHKKGPTEVRVHFDASGNGDLKYESCCEILGKMIQAKLG